MNISSLSSASLFLTPDQAAPARPRVEPVESAPPPAATTNISAAGQLRSALERLHVAAAGLGSTDQFSSAPVKAEDRASSDPKREQEQERQRLEQAAAQQAAVVHTPAPPAPNVAPVKEHKEPDIRVSLHQAAADGAKETLRQRDAHKLADRAAGAVDPEAAPKPAEAPASPPANDAGPRAPSLADVAFGKAPGAKKAAPTPEPQAAPVTAPVAAPVPQAARELASAVNEVRSAVARADKPSETDTRTRDLRDQALRALDAVNRQAEPLKSVGIERDAQGALQVNAPVLQAAVTRAPEQVAQVLGDTGRAVAAQTAPLPPVNGVPDNTDNIARATQEPAPRPPLEAPRRAAPPVSVAAVEEPAAVASQISQLSQTLDAVTRTGLQLQHELARQDNQSASQSGLQNHLNAVAQTMSV